MSKDSYKKGEFYLPKQSELDTQNIFERDKNRGRPRPALGKESKDFHDRCREEENAKGARVGFKQRMRTAVKKTREDGFAESYEHTVVLNPAAVDKDGRAVVRKNKFSEDDLFADIRVEQGFDPEAIEMKLKDMKLPDSKNLGQKDDLNSTMKYEQREDLLVEEELDQMLQEFRPEPLVIDTDLGDDSVDSGVGMADSIKFRQKNRASNYVSPPSSETSVKLDSAGHFSPKGKGSGRSEN